VRRLIAVILIVSVGFTIAGGYFIRPQTSAVNCPQSAFTASQRSITAQTEALSAQDFAAARQWSTESFRTRISEGQFARIIDAEYGILLRAPRITFDGCEQVQNDQLVVIATFDADGNRRQLGYEMIAERNGWFIQSAAALPSTTLET
jgi:hypothetical protein